MLESTSAPNEAPPAATTAMAPDTAAGYGILVHSIGSADASIVAALKSASKLPEQLLAYRLLQAPSMLFRNLPRDLAEAAVDVLRNAGVECETQHQDASFTPGDAEHEVALVVRDMQKMSAALESVATFLGVSTVDARRILCASPAVLIGRVSAATVTALQKRFAPLGVDVDVSRPALAEFDVFMSEHSPEVRKAAEKTLEDLGLNVLGSAEDKAGPLLVAGISHGDAERIHAVASRSKWPLAILNRDFQRFDVRLDAAPDTPEMRAFLVETAKMPENIVPKVLGRLPIVTHPGVRFSEMTKLVKRATDLGGRASGHLLSFRAFALRIDTVGDVQTSTTILRAIGGLSQQAAHESLTRTKEVVGPLAPTVAKWAQYELKKAGTTSRMVLT